MILLYRFIRVGGFKRIYLKQILLIIAIVIFFVGDAVQSLLAKRQESIFVNLQQAQERALEMEKSLMEAQQKFKNASNEVLEIGVQADESIQKQEKQYQNQIATDLQRLQEMTATTIYYQQQKIQKQISQKILDLAIQKVDQKFQKGLNPKVQKSVNKLSINLLRNL
uniref:ATP synthase subunit b, chloroplastic n=1 Tax=Rhipiliopsis peltata TaxID=2320810 RepID=A0A386B190_9CHLO|nr:ATP synthase CF0 subunit I [Rhipiliopsis peltata]AYC65466.1 ATP synthase CF0 subunit I [Rhipiliopsis peltata]